VPLTDLLAPQTNASPLGVDQFTGFLAGLDAKISLPSLLWACPRKRDYGAAKS
jgi:hypothetical protein